MRIVQEKTHINEKGFTLIEILVAMVIIAVGVLGIAALQFQGLKYNHDSYLRSQINFLASDIMDKMKLNKANADNYISCYEVGGADCSKTPVANILCDENTASVGSDLGCWHKLLDRSLPPGSKAEIERPANSDNYKVTLSWTSRGDEILRDVSYTFIP